MHPLPSLLLVEDNPDDVFFMRRALKAADISHPLHVVADGREAINYLEGTGPFSDRVKFPLPCLVLLDLKLPHHSGHEVLRWMRQRDNLKNLVVVILTTSNERRDIDEAYHSGANAYLVKPSSPRELIEMMLALKTFWLKHNRYPVISAGESACSKADQA